jgi:phosphatidylserine/phosphatidylglycerophosphate/cardiolipin synthase-like enzyme
VALANLAELVKFKRGGKDLGWPVGYPSEFIAKFYSPDDRVDAALQIMLWSVEHSLVIAMYGFDDPELTEIIMEKLKDPNIYVSITLDSTQAAGKHEKQLLELGLMESNSVAFGRSRGGGIMHLKEFIIDGLDVGTGSTNWSKSGETKQDNTLIVIRDPIVASETRKQLDLIHEACLTQMAAKAAKAAPAAV